MTYGHFEFIDKYLDVMSKCIICRKRTLPVYIHGQRSILLNESRFSSSLHKYEAAEIDNHSFH